MIGTYYHAILAKHFAIPQDQRNWETSCFLKFKNKKKEIKK